MKLFAKVLLFVSFIFTWILVAFSIYTILPREVDKDKLLADVHPLREVPLSMVNYPKIIVNLPSLPHRLQFLSMDLSIAPLDSWALNNIQNNDHIVKDSVIAEASRMDADELNSVIGKTLLEGRIRKRINSQFDRPIIKKIYFAQFVIQ